MKAHPEYVRTKENQEMAKNVVGLFDSMSDAHGAVQELTNAGFTSDNISIVANNASGETTNYDSTGSEAAEGAGAGAVGGAVLGGLGGLLVGLGALAIPGVGPVIAAGTLATALGTTAVGAGIGAAAGGLVGALVGAGIPEEDANLYAEGIRRGGALVSVTTQSDADADRAAEILDRYNVVDIDERGASYRESGWTRFDDSDASYASTADDGSSSAWEESSKVGTAGGTLAGAATGAAIGSVGGPVGTVIGGVAGAVTGAGVGAAGDAAGEAAADAATGEDDTTYRTDTTYSTSRAAAAPVAGTTDYSTTRIDTSDTSDFRAGTRDINADQGEVAIPVVEEEIRIGKREVDSGGVRIETRVEETPVNEQVTLRDERVTVERRAVDQPVDGATLTDAFREGTIEVREHDEEAVVAKEARIVEEVVINKEVDQRTETISDSVRRTDVDVQQLPGQARTTGYTETTNVASGTTGYAGTSDVARDTTTYTGSTGSTADSPRSEWEESSKVGTAGGGLAGAATGAAIGSVGGPVGTVIGGVAGAVTGAGVGAAGDAAGEAASDAATGEDDAGVARRDEGAIESGLSRGGNAVERGTGLDLDRDGDTGRRDPRNNF
jgi:stress response protein YsnF